MSFLMAFTVHGFIKINEAIDILWKVLVAKCIGNPVSGKKGTPNNPKGYMKEGSDPSNFLIKQMC